MSGSVRRMQAVFWLTFTLTLALAEADSDFLMPGVRVTPLRPKRQGSAILFPDSPSFEPRPRPLRVPLQSEDIEAEEGEGDILEPPEDMDLNTLDLNSLSLINSIDNITDFVKLFGMELPTPEDELLTLRTDSSPSSRLGNTRAVAELATMARCKPELQTVPLDLPVEANTYFYPTCVRLERCGGCCLGHLVTCRPKVTKVVKLKVLKTVAKRSGGNSARSRTPGRRQRQRRRRRESMPSFHEVEAIRHMQCECGCKVQQQDCDPTIHTYLERECSCTCKNQDEKKKCEREIATKFWDDDLCACFCRRPVGCSSGEAFSHASCRCERASRSGFVADALEGFLERRTPVRPLDRRPVRVPLLPDETPFPRSSRLPDTSIVF